MATDGDALWHDDRLCVLPVNGLGRQHLHQLASVPAHAETCGPVVSREERSGLVAAQHAGRGG